MAARNTFKRYFVFSVGLLLLPTAFILAQESSVSSREVVSDTETATTSAESAATQAPLSVANPNTRWFKSEQLQGVVDQGDFVVGPGRAEIGVKPGQTVVYEISVANRISDGRVFDLTVEDMTGTDDATQSVVLLGDSRGPYTIKDYISFPESSFTLALGERARIPVTISIPADAEPGGYYGGVLVSTVRRDGIEENSNAPRSPIIARIGTLFFVTVPGEVETSGETKELLQINKQLWYEKGPVHMSILFENTGSIHLNPYGEVRVHNLFGEEVGFIELEPWFVLPKSLRSRKVDWDRGLLFGRYTATAYVNRGYEDIVDTVSTTFWVLPWKIVGGAFLTLFFVLFSLRTFFRTFEFKRKK